MLPGRHLPLLVAIGAAAATAVAGTDWPQWRGPNRDGVSAESGWQTAWPKTGPERLWNVSVGKGFSGVAVAEGRLFTMGNKGGTDTVYCLDSGTGRQLWKHSYSCRSGTDAGPRVTPTVDGNRAYTLSREGHLFCFDASTGRIIWSKAASRDLAAKIPTHGLACHPLVVGKMLILELGAKGGSVVAFNKTNGGVIWQSGFEDVGYSSPVVQNMGGGPSVVVFTGSAVVGMRAADGHVLWRYKWKVDYQCAIATPIVSGDKVFVSSGYGMGCALLRVRPGRPEVLWKHKQMSNHFNSCVLWKGHLYGFDGDERSKYKPSLKCLAFDTGKVKWSQDGLGKGSLIIADGKLIVLSERGELVIAEATPRGFSEISRAKVLNGKCWTAPVLACGRIYCRNHQGDLVCLNVSAKS